MDLLESTRWTPEIHAKRDTLPRPALRSPSPQQSSVRIYLSLSWKDDAQRSVALIPGPTSCAPAGAHPRLSSLTQLYITLIDDCLEFYRRKSPIYLFRDPVDAGLLIFSAQAGQEAMLLAFANELRQGLDKVRGA